MFDSLTGRLGEVFDRLKRRGALTEAEVTAALREVRIALLEADVALSVVKDFIDEVGARAVGAEVLKSVNPAQMVVKIVHDHLTEMLGSDAAAIEIAGGPPAAILMLGLQGSGKTTTTAKLARRIAATKKKVGVVSLDVHRPAAREQLAILGAQAGVAVLAPAADASPVEIARAALESARLEGYDVVVLDTAGRLHADDEMMDEAAAIAQATNPCESLLVADALTGQDAVALARAFDERVGLTGIVLSRVDGDARGGAALSMRAVTGRPIKLIGTGEAIDALEVFHPERIAARILGMGDVVSLVEKAAETVDRDEAEKLARKIEKGGFDFDDLAAQLRQIGKMGGMRGMMSLLPGVAKVKKQLAEADIDERVLVRQQAIIGSMTKAERKSIKLIKGSRKRRIAAGSGVTVQEVNRLLKQYKQMATMMKRMGKLAKKGLPRGAPPGLAPGAMPFGPGGMVR